MISHNDASPSLGEMWETLKGMTVTVGCKPKDPMRARRELIEQYNRKPSIYVEPNIGRDCLNLIDGAAATMSGVMHQVLGSSGSEQSEATIKHHGAHKLAPGVPRCVVCDALDLSIFKALQRAICYAGAGLGLVGIGLVTVFGLCTAAGTACTVTLCNKMADNNCDAAPYDPVDPIGSELYYEGKPIVHVQNNYMPRHVRVAMPTYNYIPAHRAHYM